MRGRTTALYGMSGSGKTTQAGEYAKWIKKTTGKNTLFVAADMGGHDSIDPHIRLGFVKPVYFGETDNPWVWINEQVSTFPGSDVGLVVFDSGTSMSEALLGDAAKLSAKNIQIGSQKNLKFAIPGTPLTIGANTESHYMVVQSFMLDAIWKSTWMSRKGVDILWTFGEHKAESPTEAAIVGPKLAGKALTGSIPKWLRYTMRMVTDTTQDPPVHRMYIQEKSEMGGLGYSFANARYPLEATTALPSVIDPASIVKFWELIENGQREADENLRAELGL